MPRMARKNLETSFLHVMIQGVNREYIFNKEEYIKYYLDIIMEDQNLYHYTIIAYCIMNNHAHFLIHIEDINEFGKAMHIINLKFAKKYNKEEGRCGVIFRNRYRAEPIYDIRYLINCIRYIHENPIKAKIVEKCSDYKYSSYNEYINNDKIIKNEIMIKIFGKDYDFAKMFEEMNYIKFMGIDEKDVGFYVIAGTKKFIKKEKIYLYEIFSDRNILKKLINYLNNECSIKYNEIERTFEIPRGVINKLR